jgi:hypothetical protein
MKRIISILLLLSFPLLMEGADIPEVIEENNDYNQETCVANARNNCMNMICVTSSDINCSQNCQADAENQCEARSE